MIVPGQLRGRVQLASPPANATAQDMDNVEKENLRRLSVDRRRLYYRGEQYDQENLVAKDALGLGIEDRLPEHERRHAYSTHIEGSVDFIADQLCESFAAVAEDETVQEVIDNALRLSDQITGSNDEDDVAIDDIFRDGLIAGDVAVQMMWDPVEAQTYYEFWDSEQIEFVYADRKTLERVSRYDVIWAEVAGDMEQVRERTDYEVVANGMLTEIDGETVEIFECRRQVFWDEEDEPRETEWLGVPFIPWTLLRCDGKQIRAIRGESVVSSQCMEHADRYNANEQVAWLIARYNSHGNLAVVGDAAHLKLISDERVSKDVADVMHFPGGTNVTAITLPTDPEMIEHQRQVLSEAMFSSFGLTRIEPDTISNLNGVSGYALEILNRKTEGTFRRIRRNWIRDMRNLFNMTLDWQAYHSDVRTVTATGEPFDETSGGIPFVAFWDINPDQIYADRKIEIRMGTGYIVDDVMVRDDFNSKLISRRRALEMRGYEDEDIDQIEDELEEEKGPAPETGAFGPPSKIKAGSTVGDGETEEP